MSALRRKIRKMSLHMRLGLPLENLPDDGTAGMQVGALLEAARSSADPARALNLLGDFLEQSDRLRSRVKLTLMYPKVVLAAALMQCVFLWGLVFPHAFNSCRALWRGEALGTGPWVASMMILVVTCLWFYRSTLAKSTQMKSLSGLQLQAEQALWCRALAHLLRSGRSTPAALTTAAGVILCPTLRRQALNLSPQVAGGSHLSQALEATDFDRLVLWGAESGEARQDMPAALEDVAEELEIEAARRSQALLRWLQPAALLVLGLLTLFVMLTFWVPYYWLVTHVG